MKTKVIEEPSSRKSVIRRKQTQRYKAELPKKPKAESWVYRISKRVVVLMMGDLVLAGVSLFIAEVWAGKLEPSWDSLSNHFYWFVTLWLLWLSVGFAIRIYDLSKAYSLPDSLKSTLTAATIVTILYLLIPKLTPTPPLRRVEGMDLFILILTTSTSWRFLFARSFVHPGFQRRAVVVGAGWSGHTLVEAMSHFGSVKGNPYVGKGYELVGFIDDDVGKQGKMIGGLPVLGGSDDLVSFTNKLKLDDIILAVTNREDMNPKMFQAVLACRELGLSIISMQSLYERLMEQVPLEHSGRNLDVIIPLNLTISQCLYPIFQDTVDIILAVPGILLLSLVTPMVWIMNRLSSPGPIFYRQERVGKGGKPFMILKFRTMIVTAERDTGAVWAKKNDSRITKAGQFLRKSRLDELPQVWNMLKGDMSLIGPRPERPSIVEILEKEIPYYRLRHAVKPGITGWAQVHYGYGATVNDALCKLRYDFYYIKNRGLFLDLTVLVKTVFVVLGLKGR